MVFDWMTKQHDSGRKSNILDRGVMVCHEGSSHVVTIQTQTGISVVKEDSFCCLDCELSTTITLAIMSQRQTLPDAPVLQELGVLHLLKWWPALRSLLFWGSICPIPCTQMVTNLSGIWFSHKGSLHPTSVSISEDLIFMSRVVAKVNYCLLEGEFQHKWICQGLFGL